MHKVVIAALILAAFPHSSHAVDRVRLESFLKSYIGLVEQDLAVLRKDRPVVKALATQEKREVAVFGVVRLAVPRSYFIDWYRDIESFKQSSAVLAVHKLPANPGIGDFEALTVDPEDLKALRNCRVSDCDVKLPVSVIDRMQKEINWSAPDHQAKAVSIVRQVLLSYVQRYIAGGNPTLLEYHDQRQATRLADEFRSILQQSKYLYDYVPELHRYLENFPREKPAGAESFLYWSKEKFGLKPVVSLTHSVIYTDNRPGAEKIIIAAKQLYASHYFDASVALAALLEDSVDSTKPGFYLLYLNRSRADALRGGFSGLKRSIIQQRSVEALESVLSAGKAMLESAWISQQQKR